VGDTGHALLACDPDPRPAVFHDRLQPIEEVTTTLAVVRSNVSTSLKVMRIWG
jgi:hypothetical protein